MLREAVVLVLILEKKPRKLWKDGGLVSDEVVLSIIKEKISTGRLYQWFYFGWIS